MARRDFLRDEEFQRATIALGTTLLRMPGGSWSNYYDWLACETGDPVGCEWTWAARPSELLSFLDATGLPGMWTVRINGTAEESAALVAFAIGTVDDERVIGPDRNGRDWLTVVIGLACAPRAATRTPYASTCGRWATRCSVPSKTPARGVPHGVGRTSGPASAPSTS